MAWDEPAGAEPAFFTDMRYQVSYAAWNATAGTLAGPVSSAIPVTSRLLTIPFVTNPVGELFAFDVRARNTNARGFGPPSRVVGGPRLPCDPGASPARLCQVRNLRAAAYTGAAGEAATVTVLWDPPVEADADPTERYRPRPAGPPETGCVCLGGVPRITRELRAGSTTRSRLSHRAPRAT